MLQPCCTKQVRSARNGALSHRRRHFSRWYPIPSIPSPSLANRRKSSEQLSRAEFVEHACARCFDQAMSTTRLTPWPVFRPVSNCISPIQPNQTTGTPVSRPQFSHFPSSIDCTPISQRRRARRCACDHDMLLDLGVAAWCSKCGSIVFVLPRSWLRAGATDAFRVLLVVEYRNKGQT